MRRCFSSHSVSLVKLIFASHDSFSVVMHWIWGRGDRYRAMFFSQYIKGRLNCLLISNILVVWTIRGHLMIKRLTRDEE